MYRRLVPIPVIAFLGLALFRAYVPAQAAAVVALPGGAGFTSDGLGLSLWLFVQNAWPVVVLSVLAWLAAFNPGRRVRFAPLALKLAAMAGAAALGVWTLMHKAEGAAAAAAVLARQVHRSPALIFLIAEVPHRLFEVTGLSMTLAVLLFWLVRALQAGSLPRATFEGWVELRRLVIPGLVLLLAASLIETYLTPMATAWFLR